MCSRLIGWYPFLLLHTGILQYLVHCGCFEPEAFERIHEVFSNIRTEGDENDSDAPSEGDLSPNDNPDAPAGGDMGVNDDPDALGRGDRGAAPNVAAGADGAGGAAPNVAARAGQVGGAAPNAAARAGEVGGAAPNVAARAGEVGGAAPNVAARADGAGGAAPIITLNVPVDIPRPDIQLFPPNLCRISGSPNLRPNHQFVGKITKSLERFGYFPLSFGYFP